MGKLAEFLKTGSLGPVVLGMNPFEVVEHLDEPEQESQKKNPLTLKYGSLQLVFWKHGGQPKSQLREIVLSFQPEFEPLPDPVALDDFQGPATDTHFSEFLRQYRCMPVHMVEGESERQLIFLSGVVALFANGMLDTIRFAQKEKKETAAGPLSDMREPSRDQIVGMITEADLALRAGALRSALMIAWSGLEATLRRTALRAGRRGQVGVQPSVLIRELLSAQVLQPNEARILEELRQLRTASAHGLAPVELDPDIIPQINDISRRMLVDTATDVRKQKEVTEIIAVEAIEAYSVIIRDKLAQLLFDFFRSKGLSGQVVENAIGGDDPHHDIQIQKTIGFKEFVRLLNEWKEGYVNG
jgi:hypothetical protein